VWHLRAGHGEPCLCSSWVTLHRRLLYATPDGPGCLRIRPGWIKLTCSRLLFATADAALTVCLPVRPRWIQQADKWGGAIELAILSQHYNREIAAYDIQTKRCDLYGQDAGRRAGYAARITPTNSACSDDPCGPPPPVLVTQMPAQSPPLRPAGCCGWWLWRLGDWQAVLTSHRCPCTAAAGHTERAMLIYDGLHYDALAVSAFEGAPEELDITMFAAPSSEAEMYDAGAKKLVSWQRQGGVVLSGSPEATRSEH
jgi:hypothetical protein